MDPPIEEDILEPEVGKDEDVVSDSFISENDGDVDTFVTPTRAVQPAAPTGLPLEESGTPTLILVGTPFLAPHLSTR